MVRLVPVVVFLLVVASNLPVGAQPSRAFKTDYSITLLGLPVGRATFTSTIGDGAFRIDGSLASAGVARLFEQTEGTTSVSGALSETGTAPQSYDLNYRSDDKVQRTAIRFANGTVTATENEPPLRKRSADWVALSNDHLTSVVDPISSTLIRASTAGDVCNRTIRIYDGEMRADLALSPVRGSGAQNTVTCAAKFEPVSGYRPSRSAIQHMRDRARITITFAPLADTGFYAPVDASIGTQIGTLRIVAESVQTQ